MPKDFSRASHGLLTASGSGSVSRVFAATFLAPEAPNVAVAAFRERLLLKAFSAHTGHSLCTETVEFWACSASFFN